MEIDKMRICSWIGKRVIVLALVLGAHSVRAQVPEGPPDINPGITPKIGVGSFPDRMILDPFFEDAPQSRILTEGQDVRIRVISTYSGNAIYQWYRDSIALEGEDSQVLELTDISSAEAGIYKVSVVDGEFVGETNEVEFQVSAASAFINLSTRSEVSFGSSKLISGFVVDGVEGKTVLMRAVGPTIGGDPFNVLGTIDDPKIELKKMGGNSYEFDNWPEFEDQGRLNDATGNAGAFALNLGSRDAAAVKALGPGSYTANVTDINSQDGVALLELYDVSGVESDSRLVNISSRATVGTGNRVLVPGVVVSGDAPKRILVRAVGPSLAQFGLTELLEDPQFRIMQNGLSVGSNDNWGNYARQAELEQATSDSGAFELDDSSLDAAAIFTLEPGPYTVVVSGVGETTGTALVELYSLDD